MNQPIVVPPPATPENLWMLYVCPNCRLRLSMTQPMGTPKNLRTWAHQALDFMLDQHSTGCRAGPGGG